MTRLRLHRRWWAWTAVAAVAALLACAPPSFAHSMLLATEPVMDAVSKRSPERILLRFDEPIESGLVLIRVFDGEAREVAAGDVTTPTPEEAALAVPDRLRRGTYTVVWRVISADSDPIHGSWVFHVRRPGPNPAGVADQVEQDTPFIVSALHYGGRFLDFLLLVLCVGGAAVLVLALAGAGQDLRRRLLGLLAVLAPALAVVAILGLPLQGAAARGTGLGSSLDTDVLTSVADTRYGQFALIRALLAVALAVIVLLARRAGGRSLGPVAFVILVGLIVTPAMAGHASVVGAGAVIADAGHVQAASIWVGGLAFVMIALVLAHDRWALAASSVPRFSTMAVVSVAVLLIAGAINGYLQVRTWSGLFETEYGVLLLVKIGLVLPLLGLGAYNNRYVVPRLRAQTASTAERRRFLRAAGAELVFMAVILGVTAALVAAPPARTDTEEPGASITRPSMPVGQ